MTTTAAPTRYKFSGFSLDVGARTLFGPDGNEINLNARAFDTLCVLVRHHGNTVTKGFLMDAVWHEGVVEENNLNQAISVIRKALQDNKGQRDYVKTVARRGYCFTVPVETEAPAAAMPVGDAEARSVPPHGGVFPSVAGVAALTVLALVSIMVVVMLPDDTAQPETAEAVLPPAEENILPGSIAVLPFTVLNKDAPNTELNSELDKNDNKELFTLGLHSEIINQLAKVNSLNVIGRESVMALNPETTELSDIRRMLRVESVMYGTILYSEQRARVNLQIVDSASRVTLWAGTYETALDSLDAFISIQRDIATNVTNALQTSLHDKELEAIDLIPTASFEAYRYYLAAEQAYDNQDLVQAWKLAGQAVELDPGYLDALYAYSHFNTVMMAVPLPGMSSEQHFELALQTAQQYIEAAPERPEGYALKAGAYSTAGMFDEVLAEIDRMSAMGSSLADMKFYALLLSLGEFDEAIEALEDNLFTEPLNIYSRGFLMVAYEMAGRRQDSRRVHAVSEELNPIWWGDGVQVILALGRNEPLQDIDDMVVSGELKEMLHRVDDRAFVLDAIHRQLDDEDAFAAEMIYYSALAAYHGEHELAVAIMRDSLPKVWINLLWIWLPVYDEARKLDSFHAMLEESGATAYWEKYGWPEVCTPAAESFSCDWQAYSN